MTGSVGVHKSSKVCEFIKDKIIEIGILPEILEQCDGLCNGVFPKVLNLDEHYLSCTYADIDDITYKQSSKWISIVTETDRDIRVLCETEILTDRGYIPAESLNSGDIVVMLECCTGSNTILKECITDIELSESMTDNEFYMITVSSENANFMCNGFIIRSV